MDTPRGYGGPEKDLRSRLECHSVPNTPPEWSLSTPLGTPIDPNGRSSATSSQVTGAELVSRLSEVTTTTALSPEAEIDYDLSLIETCRFLTSPAQGNALHDLNGMIPRSREDDTFAMARQGCQLAECLASMGASDATGHLAVRECDSQLQILTLQQNFLLVGMQALLVVLMRTGLLTDEACALLFEPNLEAFFGRSKALLNDMIDRNEVEKIAKNLKASNLSSEVLGITNEEVLESLATLRLFTVNMISKVGSLPELYRQMESLIGGTYPPADRNPRGTPLLPPLPIFHCFGAPWITEALRVDVDVTGSTLIYRTATQPVMGVLAYHERDKEVYHASGPKVLLGSTLGSQQQLAWAIFASARQTIEARTLLGGESVGPLVDVTASVVKHVWMMHKSIILATMPSDGRLSLPRSFLDTAGASNNALGAIEPQIVVPERLRWAQLLTDASPAYGVSALLPLALSYLHIHMSLRIYEDSTSIQERLLFPLSVVTSALGELRDDLIFREHSIEVSEEAARRVLWTVQKCYRRAGTVLTDIRERERSRIRKASGIATNRGFATRSVDLGSPLRNVEGGSMEGEVTLRRGLKDLRIEDLMSLAQEAKSHVENLCSII